MLQQMQKPNTPGVVCVNVLFQLRVQEAPTPCSQPPHFYWIAPSLSSRCHPLSYGDQSCSFRSRRVSSPALSWFLTVDDEFLQDRSFLLHLPLPT